MGFALYFALYSISVFGCVLWQNRSLVDFERVDGSDGGDLDAGAGIRFSLPKEFRAAGIRFYLPKDFRAAANPIVHGMCRARARSSEDADAA